MDTQVKHTPGPWRVEGPDMFGDFNILHPADALAVAAVVSNMRPADEVLANANLVAAATELFEAAALALRIAENWIHDQLDGTSSLEANLAELQPVHAALAKARGL